MSANLGRLAASRSACALEKMLELGLIVATLEGKQRQWRRSTKQSQLAVFSFSYRE